MIKFLGGRMFGIAIALAIAAGSIGTWLTIGDSGRVSGVLGPTHSGADGIISLIAALVILVIVLIRRLPWLVTLLGGLLIAFGIFEWGNLDEISDLLRNDEFGRIISDGGKVEKSWGVPVIIAGGALAMVWGVAASLIRHDQRKVKKARKRERKAERAAEREQQRAGEL